MHETWPSHQPSGWRRSNRARQPAICYLSLRNEINQEVSGILATSLRLCG